jgi:hypothetical protein
MALWDLAEQMQDLARDIHGAAPREIQLLAEEMHRVEDLVREFSWPTASDACIDACAENPPALRGRHRRTSAPSGPAYTY